MDWVELIVHTTTEGSDSVSGIFMDCGAAGTMIEDRADIPDPDQPHGIWEIIDPALLESMPADVLVHAWFEEGPALRFPARLRGGLAVYLAPGRRPRRPFPFRVPRMSVQTHLWQTKPDEAGSHVLPFGCDRLWQPALHRL